MLSGSTDNVEAVRESDVTFICVGTPPLPDGSANLSAVEAVRDLSSAVYVVALHDDGILSLCS